MTTKKSHIQEESYFEGEKEEALGEIWDWLDIPQEDLHFYINYIAANAFTLSPSKKDSGQQSHKISQVYPRWPVNIRFLLTSTHPPNKETCQLNSFCILMRGYPNILQIDEVSPWQSGVEGYVSASLEDGPSVDFLAPLFYREENNYHINIWVTVYLSALALEIQPAKEEVFTFSEGELYEMELKDFLQKNPGKTKKDFPYVTVSPGKTKKDFPYVTVSTKHMTAFLPTGITSFYRYRAKILKVLPMDPFEDIEMFNLLVLLTGETPKDSLTVHLYVKKRDLHKYTPKKGDFIEGILWMFGTTHFMTGAVPTSNSIVE